MLNRKYKLKHNFGKNKSAVQNFLTELTLNSKKLFSAQVANRQVIDVRQEQDAVIGFIANVEEFLNYYQNSPDFSNIFNAISGLKSITVLPPNLRGVYGYSEGNRIFINPALFGNGILSPKERTRLYVAHELGHLINAKWLNSACQHLNFKVNSGQLPVKEAQLALNGFSLLDEATTQNRAEEFAYMLARKRRPDFRIIRNPRIFSNTPYKTNFDYYGELQSPALDFARTLRGLGYIDNDSVALKSFSDRALNPNFATNIINEYTTDGQAANLYTLLQYMGNIKNASYALFGMGDPNSLTISKANLERFNSLALSLRDFRSPNNQRI